MPESSKMKVLHLNFTEFFGGAARASNRLHLELINQGINSRMLVLKKESNDPNVIAVSSLYSKKDRLKIGLRKLENAIYQQQSENNYDNFSRLLSVLRKLDFDVLHLHWVTNGFVNFSEFKNLKAKIVWTMHDCASFTGICNVIGSCNHFTSGCGECPRINSTKKNDISNLIFRTKADFYRKTRMHFVSPSTWMAKTAASSQLLSGSELDVIPHGIDIDKYSPINKQVAREVLKIKNDAKIILCGSVTLDDENKGLSLLSQAILHLSENIDQKIELLLFGEKLRDCNFHGFTTTYLGYLKDEMLLNIVYSAADLVVVPSKQESFGLVVLEAMSCGTPVVAFDGSGPSDIIDHKINGYLAKPYSHVDLAEGIRWCLNNSRNLNLPEMARRKVISDFNIKLIASKYFELYKKILS